jgi:hypothetical protein
LRQSQWSRTKIDQFVTTKFYYKLPFSIYYFGEGIDQKEITHDRPCQLSANAAGAAPAEAVVGIVDLRGEKLT